MAFGKHLMMIEVWWTIPEPWVRREIEHYCTYKHMHTLPMMLTCPQSTLCTSMHESSVGIHGIRSTHGGCSPDTQPHGLAEGPESAGNVHNTSPCIPGWSSSPLSTEDAAGVFSGSCDPTSWIMIGWCNGCFHCQLGITSNHLGRASARSVYVGLDCGHICGRLS